MSDRTIPILTCRDLDDVHFASVPGFDPEGSPGSTIVLVSDTGALFDTFAAGLRERFGKLPIAGRARIDRPRRKQGTSGGFAIVDPGGNAELEEGL